MANQLGKPPAELVAVTKTFSADQIEPVIQSGCRVFGENRVQEAQSKWPSLKEKYPGIELHLIGPLQSNKAKDAVALFDVIQTIDRKKIASAVHREMKRQSRPCRLFVQVNIGSEAQKAGVAPEEVRSFVSWCRDEEGLNIAGLMCIPPIGENPGPYFALMRKMGRENGVLFSTDDGCRKNPKTQVATTDASKRKAIFDHCPETDARGKSVSPNSGMLLKT